MAYLGRNSSTPIKGYVGQAPSVPAEVVGTIGVQSTAAAVATTGLGQVGSSATQGVQIVGKGSLADTTLCDQNLVPRVEVTATGASVTGAVSVRRIIERKTIITQAAGGTVNLDTANFGYFQLNLNATGVTLNFGTPVSGTDTFGFTLKIVEGGLNFSLTFPTNGTILKWDNGQMPTRTTTSGAVNYYYFWTEDNGSTWYGTYSGQDMK